MIRRAAVFAAIMFVTAGTSFAHAGATVVASAPPLSSDDQQISSRAPQPDPQSDASAPQDTSAPSDSQPQHWWSGSGSPYVELDSWIYPAIERLAALGYIHSEYLDMRPWTRFECALMLTEAADRIENQGSAPAESDLIYEALQEEFRRELDALNGKGPERTVALESLYSDVLAIDGKPLNDSDHFGQTIINNFGRPYEEGFNAYDGFSAYATAGRFTIYTRAEYQHAPSAPAYSLLAQQAIAAADGNPLQPPAAVASVDRFTLLDTYVSSDLDNWNLAFGKQSLWWGPGEGGALLFSDNAEPIYMFRANRVRDFRVPYVSRLFGPFNVDAFVGKLSGNQFPPRPLIHGEKISFKPTENLEVSFARTVEFGGVGRALTLGAIWNSYVSVKSSGNYRASVNPGKRSSSIEFVYKVPFVRNWLSVYTDSLAPDDVLPLANPPRSAWVPGFYMPRLPRLEKFDLRVEAGYTDAATTRSVHGQFVYFDFFYHDLYTNKGNLIGSWIGREGDGVQSWLTYHLGARNTLQFAYRHEKVAKDFIPSGETLNDGSLKLDWMLTHDLSVSGSLQYEKWAAPILAPIPQTNWTTSLGITFTPHSWSW